MTTHKIYLEPVNKTHAQMFWNGKNIGELSFRPLYDAAWILWRMGVAKPHDTIETWLSDTKCQSSLVWAAINRYPEHFISETSFRWSSKGRQQPPHYVKIKNGGQHPTSD